MVKRPARVQTMAKSYSETKMAQRPYSLSSKNVSEKIPEKASSCSQR